MVMTCKSEIIYLYVTVLILLIKSSILIYFSIADQHSLSCVDAFKTSVLSWYWMLVGRLKSVVSSEKGFQIFFLSF